MKGDADKSKLLEKVLMKSETLFLSLADRMVDTVAIIDWNGSILFTNSAGAKLAGLESPGDCIGLNVQEFTHPDFHPLVMNDLQLIKDGMRGLSANYRNYKAITRSGEEKWIEGAGSLVHFEGNTAAIVALRDITERTLREEALQKREEELVKKSHMLEDINTTLSVLLKRRKQDKEELEEKVLANIKELVIPYIDMLKSSRMDERNRAHVDILESNLKNIISPFSLKLSSKILNLTPKEIRIASLIKEGKTTKEMAEILNITRASIDTHRHNIRNKFGLNNKKVNLRSYLSSIL